MRKWLAAALLTGMLCTGCSFQFTVPDVDMAIAPPTDAEKIPLTAAVLVPDENLLETRTFQYADTDYTFTIPVGKMVQKSSREIIPPYFAKAVVVKSQKEAAGFDLVFIPRVTDFGFDSNISGISTNHIKGRVSLQAIANDPKGAVIWEKTVTSPWTTKTYQGLSTDLWLQHYGMALTEATAVALKDAIRQMSMSRMFQDYVAAGGKGETRTASVAAAPEPPPSAIPLRPDAYAIVIGIDYRGRGDLTALKYAAQDAREVYGILTDPRYGGVPKENALLLLNEKATRNELVAALRKIKTWPGYVTVYYSGYGAPRTQGEKFSDGLLVPYDAVLTDPDALEDTSIRLSYLRDLVDASQAKGILVALDTGFTGGGKSVLPKGGKPLVGMLAAAESFKLKGAGRILITSSAVNQPSWEDESELKGGIFGHYLVEGLKGKTGKETSVKADDLAGYLKENVPKAARRLKGTEQVPQITGSGDFTVTRNWERAQTADAEIARGKLKGALEKGQITVEQVSRAMDELRAPQRTKTLDAFLQGKIDGMQFGELY